MALKIVPCELKDANKFVEELHRHHKPVTGHRFSIGVNDTEGILRGVVIVGRPVARRIDQRNIVEAVRCCTDGTPNTCSALYSAAARAAREIGYKKIITYILQSESGVSLKAAGWVLEEDNVGGGEWNCKARPREEGKYPTEKKQRWCKVLNS